MGKAPRTRFFAGRDIFRLVSMAIMLAILAITISRMRMLSQTQAPLPPPPPDVPLPEEAAKEPAVPAAGDPDPTAEEFKAFTEEAALITDRTTAIHPTEMPAYWRVVGWAKDQTTAELRQKATEVSFHELVHHPAKYRGRLVHVDLAVRRVLGYDAPAENRGDVKKLYELWGWPTDASGWLYVAVTPQLPSGLSPAEHLEVTANFYGYFFKLQGYQPAQAKPGARPLVAPLLIGRLALAPRAVAAQAASKTTYIAVAIGSALFAIALAGWVILRKRRRPGPPAYFQLEPDAEDYAPSPPEAANESEADPDFDWLKNP